MQFPFPMTDRTMSTELFKAAVGHTHDNAQLHGTNDPVPPMLARSLRAYLRDLPELLKTHRGKRVAHHGEKVIGYGHTERALYDKRFRLGIREHEFLISRIAPEITAEEITWSSGV